MRRLLFSLFVVAGSLLSAAESPPLPEGLYAEFTTPRGVFTAKLFYDQVPMTVGSFVGLAEGSIAAKDGKPFFSGLKWYRVVPNFVIQSGDPTNPGGGIQDRPPQTPEQEKAGHPYNFPDEIVPGLHHDDAGVLSMANGGPDTNSSEFFVTLRETNRLNYLHSVFGRVVRGLEVLPLVKENDAFSIKILRVGAAAKAFKADEAALKSRMAAAKKYTAGAEPGPAEHFDDPDKVLPQDPPRAKNFNYKLANFERFTGKRIYGRVYKEFKPLHEGQKLGAFNAELAQQFKIDPDGVLVNYFVDLDTWMIWIGEDLLPKFMGRSGTREEFVGSGALMKQKDVFLRDAKKRGEEVAARAVAEGRPVNDAQRLKLTIDEVLDAFILMTEPKTKP